MQTEKITNFYTQIFANKNVNNKTQLIQTLCDNEDKVINNIEVINSAKQIEFSTSEIQQLAEKLLSLNGIYLKNFLQLQLKAKQWQTIIAFFSKVYVQHIGNIHFTSKNASSFDMGERAFDRFIESMQFFNFQFSDYIEFLFTILNCSKNSQPAKWKRPVFDYLLDYAVKNESVFLKFIFDNFSQYGMMAFEFLIYNNVPFAIPKLVDFYLNNSFDEKRQVKNLLKQHYIPVREYVLSQLKSFNISTKQAVEIFLCFLNEKDARKRLNDFYFKEKDANVRKLIVEKITIKFEQEINTIIKFKKQCQKYNNDDLNFLNMPNFKMTVLKLKDNKEENGAGAFVLEQYKNLCSPYECFKTEFIKEYVSEKSLNILCNEVYFFYKSQNFDEKYDWLFTLIAQNASQDTFVEIIKDLVKSNELCVKLLNRLAIISVACRYFDLLDCLLKLDKQNRSENEIVKTFLQWAEQNSKYDYNKIELIRDLFAHRFNFEQGNTIKIEPAVISVDADLKVVTKLNNAQTEQIKQVQSITKNLERELSKQSKRLQLAFASGRLWSKEQFTEIFLKPSVFNILAERLLWGRYKGNKLISVFRISNYKVIDMEAIDTNNINQFEIGIFHPVEYPNTDWARTFNQGKPPFNQLEREVSTLSSYNQQSLVVNRFNGLIVNADNFVFRLKNQDWILDKTMYDGSVDRMFKFNKDLQTLAEITFLPVNLSVANQITTLQELRFYRIDSVIPTGNYWITNKMNSQEIGSVNERFFSDAIYEIFTAGKK